MGHLRPEAFLLKLDRGLGLQRLAVLEGGVKETIREIIAAEGESLSDQKIVEILAGRGISLARRTVAKYRGELAIDSSYQRRRV